VARRALSPDQLALVQAVRATLNDVAATLRPTEDAAPARVAVACSGGADSLALAAAVVWCRQHDATPPFRPFAVVVDHGLQPDSAAVAARTCDVLSGLELHATLLTVTVPAGPPEGIEAAARDARYDALAGVDADLVLLGHTLDDQAETVLLGLARGSGTRSLAGMPTTFRWSREVVPMSAESPSPGPLFARPLLGVRRTTTRQACADGGLAPWDDPMNADERFARVRARRLVADLESGLGPGVADALARTATLARADADYLDDLARAALGDAAEPDGTLPAGRLRGLPAPLAARVLRLWLIGRGVPAPTYDQTTAVLALVDDWHGQRGVDLPGGCVVRRANRLKWQPGGRPGASSTPG